jgi:cytochrome c-type biogenesis protein CcmH
MIPLLAFAALLTGVAALAMLILRVRRAHVASLSAPEQIDQVRRQLAVLKIDLNDGKLSETEHRARRRELTSKLLELSGKSLAMKAARTQRAVLGGVAVAGLALGVGMLWWQVAQRPLPESATRAALQGAPVAHPLSAEQLERTVAQTRERVKTSPKDAAAWAMLAHSYDMLGRYAEAGEAYAQLVELLPNDAQVLADYADSMAVSRGRKLDGEPLKLVQRALTLDPKNLKALALAGTEAFDRKEFSQAIAFWERARAQISDTALRQEIDKSIADARQLQVGAVAASGVAASSVQPTGAQSVGFVAGRVSLSDKLKSQVSGNDTLFVFARPADGSRMPVALMRRRASELPLEFRLDDSMAMVPQMRLSAQARVVVGARISKRGDATPKPGDFQGISAPVAVGAQGLRIDVEEVVK